jgi:glucosamine kinase
MMLIADSGATKTDWIFSDINGSSSYFSTIGFNPLFSSSKEIAGEIIKSFPSEIKKKIFSQKSCVYYYGTGCSSKERKQIVFIALNKVFPKSRIAVEHDMLASARAVCKNEKGIAAILGTGSNSCYYDGKKITRTIGGLTYIFGDEGSGAHIGLLFIKAFLNKELPEKIHKMFFNEFRLTPNLIYNSVYNKKYPNRFLASFAKFVLQYIDNRFLHNLVYSSFSDFFEKTICKYEDNKYVAVGFTGSIAYNFKTILYEVAKERKITINKILPNPIKELVKYHLAFT